MVNINLGDPNVVDNFKALDNLRSTGSHIIRMYDELTELKGRYAKLLQYYDNHRSQLDSKQQDLMMSQRAIMEEYIGVLEARIDYDTQLYSK